MEYVAVLSGGQDSSTVLAHTMQADEHRTVKHAVNFHYGQRHAVERDCARWWCEEFGIELHEIEVSSLREVGNSQLIDTDGEVSASHPAYDGLPASFVPGRNLVMFTVAAALAVKVGAGGILSGVCQRDYSGYPDCRAGTLMAVEESVRRGMDFPTFDIYAPLLDKTKADTWAMADAIGRVPDVIEHTHTCYEGDRTRHEWGYGCGECPACKIRKKGYYEWLDTVDTMVHN